MSFHRFALASLATWRVTHLLADEDGPADVVVRLRAHLGDGPLGGLMDCFQCLSVWVAAPLSVGLTRKRRPDPVAWLALSGAACLLEQATAGRAFTNHQEM
jgi:hypothetical protein